MQRKNLPNYIKQALSQDEINLLFHNDSLPQGAPTSPFVSNLYLADADGIIYSICLGYLYPMMLSTQDMQMISPFQAIQRLYSEKLA